MANKLEHLAEFQKILDEYEISAAGKKLLAKTKLILMVGPSGAGRNTIINALVRTGSYHYIVSDTTRKPRENNGVKEQSGREYWFRSEEQVLADLKAGKFLEAAVIHNQQVSGTSLRELEKANKLHEVAVTEVETVGMKNIIQAKPDTFALFVAPPSFSVWMERLQGRGPLPEVETRRRLESAVKEYENALTNDFYTYIINDAFEHSVERIHQLVFEGKHDVEHQALGRNVIERLLIDTREHLHK